MALKFEIDKITKLSSEIFNAVEKLNELSDLKKEDFLSDTFKVMGELGAFPAEFVEKLREMVKFRNRLVHIYWEINDEIIFEILREDIHDITEFVDRFMKFISEKNPH